MKRVLVSVLGLFLASCASYGELYVEPLDQPITTIKFSNRSSTVASVEMFKKYETCQGRMQLKGDSIGPGRSFVTRVRADEPMSFSLGYAIYPSAYCRVYLTFTPVRSRAYVAEITPLDESCSLQLYTLEAGQKKAVSARQREPNKWIFDENSSFCK